MYLYLLKQAELESKTDKLRGLMSEELRNAKLRGLTSEELRNAIRDQLNVIEEAAHEGDAATVLQAVFRIKEFL